MGQYYDLDVVPAVDHYYRGSVLIDYQHHSALPAADLGHHPGHDDDYPVPNLHHHGQHHHSPQHDKYDTAMPYLNDDQHPAGDDDNGTGDHHDHRTSDDHHDRAGNHYDDSAGQYHHDDPGIYDHYICAGLDHHHDPSLDNHFHVAGDDHHDALAHHLGHHPEEHHHDGAESDNLGQRSKLGHHHGTEPYDDRPGPGDHDDNLGGSGRRTPGAEQYAALGGAVRPGLHRLQRGPVGGGRSAGHPRGPRPVRIDSLGQAQPEVSIMTFLGRNPATTYRYFLKASWGQWTEVTKEQWVSTERAAGFTHNTRIPTEPGSTAFSNGAVRGIIITSGVSVPSDFDWAQDFRDCVWPEGQ